MWAIVAAVAVVVLLIAAAIGGSWYFSSLLLVPDHSDGPFDVEVREVGPGRVVLPRSEDTLRPGLYGLDWEGGHAILGRVLASGDDSVTRAVRDVRGRLEAGTDTSLDPTVWEGNPRQARGLPFESVRYPDELGPMPAWQIGRGSGTWAIFVHGHDGTPTAGLRIAPTLRRSGLPTLLITYRNDRGAPPADDGLIHLGMTEWRDLEAAVQFAIEGGARRLVLIGYSMGGSIVTQFMERSPLARRVSGLVLDAPALSWKPILDLQARDRGLPELFTVPVEWMVGLRIDINWERLDALRHTADLQLPILLFHGTEDQTVPISTSEALARELPREVTFHRVPEAGHTESWNVDPARYQARLRAFLSRIGAGAAAANREGPRA